MTHDRHNRSNEHNATIAAGRGNASLPPLPSPTLRYRHRLLYSQLLDRPPATTYRDGDTAAERDRVLLFRCRHRRSRRRRIAARLFFERKKTHISEKKKTMDIMHVKCVYILKQGKQ